MVRNTSQGDPETKDMDETEIYLTSKIANFLSKYDGLVIFDILF